MLITPREVMQKEASDWAKSFGWRPTDGLLIGFLKLVFGLRIWRLLFEAFVGAAIGKVGVIDKAYEKEDDARRWVWIAADAYMLFWTLLLALMYVLTYFMMNQSVCAASVVLTLSGLVTIFRVTEILAVMVELHTAAGYPTAAPARAVVNTLWHYIEIMIAFATFHVCASVLQSDPYHGPFKTLWEPLYFSFVTMTTLGYGDFAPQKAVGQALVVVEVLIGIVLLVIAVQRALSISLVGSQSATKQ